MRFDYEEELDDGLRYTEMAKSRALCETIPALGPLCGDNDRPATVCLLWGDGEDQPVSFPAIYSFEQRFGQTAVPVEGYGRVSTAPEHRCKGYIARLLTKSIERAFQRVDALFLFGISQLYTKFGFVPCMVQSELVLPVHAGEAAKPMSGASIRPMSPADYPAMCDIYTRTIGCCCNCSPASSHGGRPN